jgi:hypothetical protein
MSSAPQHSRPTEAPDFDRLLRTGWAVGSVVGRYCVAWRGAEEVVLVWESGEWRQVAGRGASRAA